MVPSWSKFTVRMHPLVVAASLEVVTRGICHETGKS